MPFTQSQRTQRNPCFWLMANCSRTKPVLNAVDRLWTGRSQPEEEWNKGMISRPPRIMGQARARFSEAILFPTPAAVEFGGKSSHRVHSLCSGLSVLLSMITLLRPRARSCCWAQPVLSACLAVVLPSDVSHTFCGLARVPSLVGVLPLASRGEESLYSPLFDHQQVVPSRAHAQKVWSVIVSRKKCGRDALVQA